MTAGISERGFEDATEQALLAHGLDAYPGKSILIREAEEVGRRERGIPDSQAEGRVSLFRLLAKSHFE